MKDLLLSLCAEEEYSTNVLTLPSLVFFYFDHLFYLLLHFHLPTFTVYHHIFHTSVVMVRFFGNQLTCKLGCGYCGRGGVLECCYSDESAIMALPRVSANLPPYNPSKSTLAFGDRTLPKIVSQLVGVYEFLHSY